jgi:hypothetical protein
VIRVGQANAGPSGISCSISSSVSLLRARWGGLGVFSHVFGFGASCQCCCDAGLVEDPGERELRDGHARAGRDWS